MGRTDRAESGTALIGGRARVRASERSGPCPVFTTVGQAGSLRSGVRFFSFQGHVKKKLAKTVGVSDKGGLTVTRTCIISNLVPCIAPPSPWPMMMVNFAIVPCLWKAPASTRTPSTVHPLARGFCPHGRPGPLGFGLCGRLPRHGVGGFVFNSSPSARQHPENKRETRPAIRRSARWRANQAHGQAKPGLVASGCSSYY